MKRWFSFLLVLTLGLIPALTHVQPVHGLSDINVGGACTLRDAVSAANRNQPVGGCPAGSPGMDTIHIPAGKFDVSGAAGDDDNVSGDLDIHEPLRIEGAGLSSTILSSDGSDRLLHFHFNSRTVSIEKLTLEGGKGADSGGAIRSEGIILTLAYVRIVNNQSQTTGGGIAAVFVQSPPNSGDYYFPFTSIDYSVIGQNSSSNGGGIYSQGAVVLKRSTVWMNTASSSGGGLDNSDFSGLGMVLDNVTVSENNGPGAAIANSGDLTILNSTIYNNNGRSSMLMHLTSLIRISGSILGKTVGGVNCEFASGQFALISDGSNLEDKNSCGLGSGDFVNTDPKLGSMDVSNGPTPFLPLQPGSPAIDGGLDSVTCFGALTDQRGEDRPMDGPDGDLRAQCDIGAYEFPGTKIQRFFQRLPVTIR